MGLSLVDGRELTQCLAAGRAAQRIVRLRRRLETYTAKLVLLRRYDTSEFGEKLGLTVDTPCVDCGTAASFVPFWKVAERIAKVRGLKRVHKRMPAVVLIHRCDNTRCVEPTHIIYGTQSDNMRDALLKGRVKRKPGDIAQRIADLERELPRLCLAIRALESGDGSLLLTLVDGSPGSSQSSQSSSDLGV